MQNTLNPLLLRELHGALIDIVSLMNQPQRDAAMVRAADIPLDGALFPLLVMVERLGPIGIGNLADRVGRDHTTVSRQVTKLEQSGLVERRLRAGDGRARDAAITAPGRAMTERIDAARWTIARRMFRDWPGKDIADLVRLLRRFADAAMADPPG